MNHKPNKRKSVFKAMAVTAAAMVMTSAAMADWKSGYGQGNLEFFHDNQDLRLYIGCPTQDGDADRPSSLTMRRISTGLQIGKFTVSVNGHTFEGPFKSDSRVGSGNFRALLEDLRKGDAVVQYASGRVVFPKTNAAKVIPPPDLRFPCNTVF